jgi:hypothetical protein
MLLFPVSVIVPLFDVVIVVPTAEKIDTEDSLIDKRMEVKQLLASLTYTIKFSASTKGVVQNNYFHACILG